MSVEALPRIQEPQTYIEPEETTWRNRAFQIVAIVGALLGAGLFLASFYTAIPWFVGVGVAVLSLFALHYIRNASSNLAENAEKGNQCMVNFLLFLGANPAERVLGFNWRTSLHAAANNGHEEMVNILLENGTNPDGLDIFSDSPLYRAVLNGHMAVVKILLEKGADSNLCRNGSDSPLFCATKSQQESFVKILLEKGADPNLGPHGEDSPLFCAIESQQENIVELLLNHEANAHWASNKLGGISCHDFAVLIQNRLADPGFNPASEYLSISITASFHYTFPAKNTRTLEERKAAAARIVELLQAHNQPVED